MVLRMLCKTTACSNSGPAGTVRRGCCRPKLPWLASPPRVPGRNAQRSGPGSVTAKPAAANVQGSAVAHRGGGGFTFQRRSLVDGNNRACCSPPQRIKTNKGETQLGTREGPPIWRKRTQWMWFFTRGVSTTFVLNFCKCACKQSCVSTYRHNCMSRSAQVNVVALPYFPFGHVVVCGEVNTQRLWFTFIIRKIITSHHHSGQQTGVALQALPSYTGRQKGC